MNMDEQEILIRAREAVIAEHELPDDIARHVREGGWQGHVRAAARALRDLTKSLSEIRPVDPDLIEARKIAADYVSDSEAIASGKWDDHYAVRRTLAAIKRGRELALLTPPGASGI